jgi:GR25 family glycosyltransferase involved in LPS biosynthesis
MKILYINLDERTDRREGMETVLAGMDYERISAIKHHHGTIGASMSHIKALEYAISKKWREVLIMEDDMKWNNFDENNKKLAELMKKTYNVIILGGTLVSHDPETHKLHKCNSAGAYIVNNHYMKILLQHFQKGLQNLLKTLKLQYIIDVYWHKLQHDNWFILPMCYSDEGYSDILKRNINWKDLFLS